MGVGAIVMPGALGHAAPMAMPAGSGPSSVSAANGADEAADGADADADADAETDAQAATDSSMSDSVTGSANTSADGDLQQQQSVLDKVLERERERQLHAQRERDQDFIHRQLQQLQRAGFSPPRASTANAAPTTAAVFAPSPPGSPSVEARAALAVAVAGEAPPARTPAPALSPAEEKLLYSDTR